MEQAEYVVLQQAVRLDRPEKAYKKWIARSRQECRWHVPELKEPFADPVDPQNDPYCPALLKRYGGLMPLAQEARKPIFHLKPADGAIGAHALAAQHVYRQFKPSPKRLPTAPAQRLRAPRPEACSRPPPTARLCG